MHAITQLVVNRVLMVETGRYNQMFARPYETNINGPVLNTLVDRIVNTGSKHVTSSLLSGISANIAAPSATPQQAINIVNGWNERRIRFTIEIGYSLSTGTTGIYYLQGYTNHSGVGMNGAVDPNMEFIINSYTTVNRLPMLTPTGYQYVDKIEDSAQVYTGVDGTMQTYHDVTYGLRPEDIYKGMQASFLTGGAEAAGMAGSIDFRSNLGSKPNHSKRANNIPSAYVGEIVNSYMVGQDLAQFGQGHDDILSRVLHITAEPSVHQNFFFQRLAQIKQFMTNRFNWRDLTAIDPSVDSKTQFFTRGDVVKVGGGQDAMSAQYWTGSDRVTQMASMLAAAIPGMMMQFMIQNVHFRSTNHDAMGRVNTTFIDVKSTTNLDMRRNIELFRHQLESEIITDLTMNGQDSYMLDMKCDLFGETWINLSLGIEPMATFAVPSFCDALFMPVVTHNQDHYSHITNDMNQLVAYVSEEVNTATQAQSGFTVAQGI